MRNSHECRRKLFFGLFGLFNMMDVPAYNAIFLMKTDGFKKLRNISWKLSSTPGGKLCKRAIKEAGSLYGFLPDNPLCNHVQNCVGWCRKTSGQGLIVLQVRPMCPVPRELRKQFLCSFRAIYIYLPVYTLSYISSLNLNKKCDFETTPFWFRSGRISNIKTTSSTWNRNVRQSRELSLVVRALRNLRQCPGPLCERLIWSMA